MNVDGVTLEDCCIVCQLTLENSLWVSQVNECSLMRLELDIGALIQRDIPEHDLSAFLQKQLIHHPDWDVASALFS